MGDANDSTHGTTTYWITIYNNSSIEQWDQPTNYGWGDQPKLTYGNDHLFTYHQINMGVNDVMYQMSKQLAKIVKPMVQNEMYYAQDQD